MPGADAGGISTVVLNYYRFIDRSKIHFDVALNSDIFGQNGAALAQLGVNFYHLPMKSKGILNYFKALSRLLRENQYDAIHVHESETSYVSLAIAKMAGIPKRFAHAHTTSPVYSLKDEIKRLSGCVLNYHFATCIIACGKLSGQRVFGKINMQRKKSIVLPNAIDTDIFSYNEQVRNNVRKKMQLENKLTIGMIGRLSAEKNHMFALNIMKQLHYVCPDATLLIVGNGPEEKAILNKIADEQMEAYVTMLGRRSDVAQICQALDVLIMPSFSEGFPVAAVEAMAAGLPVLLSDTITSELSFGHNVHYLSLKNSAIWVNMLLEYQDPADRTVGIKQIVEHCLDIHRNVQLLEELYLT